MCAQSSIIHYLFYVIGVTDNSKCKILPMLATSQSWLQQIIFPCTWCVHALFLSNSFRGWTLFFFPIYLPRVTLCATLARPHAVSHAVQNRVIEVVISQCTSHHSLRTACQHKGGGEILRITDQVPPFIAGGTLPSSSRCQTFLWTVLKFTPHLLPFFLFQIGGGIFSHFFSSSLFFKWCKSHWLVMVWRELVAGRA